jgi:hypothetical protein
MAFLNNTLHAAIDYATVVIFLAAPQVIGLTGLAEILSYALAVIHFAMTIATNMPASLVKIIPLKLHATVELIVGPVLILAAFALPQFSAQAQIFFAAMGLAVCLVWFLSEYKTQ